MPNDGWCSLDEWWEHWSGMTNPPISAELVLAGRQDEVGGLRDWIQGAPDRYYVQANTRDEAIAFAAACATSPDGPWNALLLSRAIVVRTPDAWQYLEHHRVPLVLIRDFTGSIASQAAVQKGHHVLTPLDNLEEPHGSGSRLPSLGRAETPAALLSMGLTESAAHSLISKSNRRLSVMRRSLLDESGAPPPEWVSSMDAIVPLILIGQWDTNYPADRDIVAEMMGKSYEDVERRLGALASVPDSPLEKIRDRWRLVSHEDAWHFLAPQLTTTDLQKLSIAALKVLGESSPAFEMPVDERYLASIRGKVPSYSDVLREGIARSLAIMAVQGSRAKFAEGVHGLPAHVVRSVLANDTSWTIWASLDRNLQLLAEAAPDAFLDAVEAGLSESPNPFKELFDQEGDAIFTATPHTGMLWALECLAWSEDHFSRVAKIFARLAELDPRGQVSNRPINSLSEMFLPWIKFSDASDDDRLATLSMLLDIFPKVGWEVLLRARSELTVTERRPPSWRHWAQGGASLITDRAYSYCISGLNRLLVGNLQDDVNRWGEVLDNLSRFETEVRQVMINLLQEQLDVFRQSPKKDTLWAKVRGVLHHHRRYANAAWAISDTDLQPLQVVYQELTPDDAVQAYAWLFRNLPFDALPDVPDPIPVTPDSVDLDADLQHLLRRQRAAVSNAYDQGGMAVIVQIAESAPSPYQVGRVVALTIDGELSIHAALNHLGANNQALRAFAHGVLHGLFDQSGWSILETALKSLKTSAVHVDCIADVYLVAPVDSDTWERLGDEDQAVRHSYWERVHPFRVPTDDDTSPCVAVQQLLDVHRSAAALNLVMHASVPSSLIVRVLEQLPQDPTEDTQFAGLRLDGFRVAELFKRLDADDEVSDEVIAGLEIPYISLLVIEGRTLAIHRQVLQSPSLFADLIAWMFKRADGQPDDAIDDQRRQNRAHNAFSVLHQLPGIPGVMNDGTVDYETLKAWVGEARRLCSDRLRADIGDQYIGQILANAPSGDDGVWPCEPVRALLEGIGSRQLGVGFVIGRQNQRGITSRGLFDGGVQERTLAASYQADAARIGARWPLVAKLLREIAGDYQVEGRMHDREADWHDR